MYYRKEIFFLIIYLFSFFVSSSQHIPKVSAIKVNYANDFFTGTDQYFTQGIRIELISPLFKNTPVRFLNIFPSKNHTIYYSIAIQQDGFTPTSIRYDSVLSNDRPFCGSLFFTNSMFIFSKKKKRTFHTQIDMGAIGPLALGYEEQTVIHKAINDELPRGWKNQIQNDLILNYKLETEHSVIDKKYIDISAVARTQIGTMFTDAGIQANMRIGYKNKWYEGFYTSSGKKIQLYTCIKANAKAVAYNATLQGGMFNKKNVYTISGSQIERLVLGGEWLLNFSYRKIIVEYSHSYLTKEFRNGTAHAWGKLSLMIGF